MHARIRAHLHTYTRTPARERAPLRADCLGYGVHYDVTTSVRILFKHTYAHGHTTFAHIWACRVVITLRSVGPLNEDLYFPKQL